MAKSASNHIPTTQTNHPSNTFNTSESSPKQGFSFVFTPACGWAITNNHNQSTHQQVTSSQPPVNRPNIRLTTLGFEAVQGAVPVLLSPSAHVIDQSMLKPGDQQLHDESLEWDEIESSESDRESILRPLNHSLTSQSSEGEEEPELVAINDSFRQSIMSQPLSILISPLPYKLTRRPLPPSPYYPDSEDETQESTTANVANKQMKTRSSNIPYSVGRASRPPVHQSTPQSKLTTFTKSPSTKAKSPIATTQSPQYHRPLVVSKRSLSQGSQPLPVTQSTNTAAAEMTHLQRRAVQRWNKASPWKRFKTDDKPYQRPAIDYSSDTDSQQSTVINDDSLINQSKDQSDSPVIMFVRSRSDGASQLSASRSINRAINHSTTVPTSAKRTRSGIIKQGQRKMFDFFAKETIAQ